MKILVYFTLPQPLVPSLPLWPQHDGIYRTPFQGGLLAGPITPGQTGIEEAVTAQHILTPTPTSRFHSVTRDAETRQGHSRRQIFGPGFAQRRKNIRGQVRGYLLHAETNLDPEATRHFPSWKEVSSLVWRMDPETEPWGSFKKEEE